MEWVAGVVVYAWVAWTVIHARSSGGWGADSADIAYGLLWPTVAILALVGVFVRGKK